MKIPAMIILSVMFAACGNIPPEQRQTINEESADQDGATACTPDCRDRQCGVDHICGASCGQCDQGLDCIDGQCVDTLCAGVECPECQRCVAGYCVDEENWTPCTPDDDVCTRDMCQYGQCVNAWIYNDCQQRECGMSPSQCYDCGSCPIDLFCNEQGRCQPEK